MPKDKKNELSRILAPAAIAVARGRGTALAKAPTSVVTAELSRNPLGIVLSLRSGLQVLVPLKALPAAIARADIAALREIEIAATRDAVWFPRVDEGFSVGPVLVALLGDLTRRELNRAAGSASSAKKAAAARTNGRKGGRPRKAA